MDESVCDRIDLLGEKGRPVGGRGRAGERGMGIEIRVEKMIDRSTDGEMEEGSTCL
jgi:hypothetical protein